MALAALGGVKRRLGGTMANDPLKPLRDKLIRACEGYDADQSIRAMASALTTIVLGTAKDQAAAHLALDRLFAAMRLQVHRTARPADG
jgi:hypothetical protein